MLEKRTENKMYLLLYEQRYDYPDYSKLYGVCAWCNQPGGDGFQPFILRGKTTNWGVLEMHEWLFKRNRNLPEEVTFSLENMILLHRECHSKYGQSKEMVKKCYFFKRRFYDLQKWVDKVAKITKTTQINLKETYGDDNMKQQNLLFVDVQTMLDPNYIHLVDNIPPQDVNVNLDEFSNLPIKNIKEFIKENIYFFFSKELHTKLLEIENNKEKPRQGLIDEIGVREREYEKLCLQLSATPQLVKIVSLGFGYFEDDKFKIQIGINHPNSGSKSSMPLDVHFIKMFWDYIKYDTTLVAYALSSFTLPVIMAKTMQIPPKERQEYRIIPSVIDTSPWKGQVLDLQHKLFQRGYKTLDWAYEAYTGNKPYNKVSGSDIPSLYKLGKINEIKDYSKSRLHYSMALYLAGAGIYFPDYLRNNRNISTIKNNLPSSFNKGV